MPQHPPAPAGDKGSEFCRALVALYEQAGEPTYAELIHKAAKQKPPLTIGKSSLGDWLNAVSVPSSPQVVAFLVSYLQAKATQRGHPATRPPGWWETQRMQAQRRRRANLGGRSSRRPAPGNPPVISLPSELEGFVGRERAVRKLLAALGDRRTVVLAGMPGVGKTALALRVAHETVRSGLFPGGALFTDLNGYAGKAELGPALESVLRTLGVHDLPATEAGRVALYRSTLAERQDPLLIVIDNAASADVVEALLPGLGDHRILVTSRHSLPSLPGAYHYELGVLTVEESIELLGTALCLADKSDTRVEESPEQVRRLIRLCGRLPLALQITAALLKGDRFGSLTGLADDLTDERTRLGKLKFPDKRQLGVRAAFRLSYKRLPKSWRRLLVLLSWNPRYTIDEEILEIWRLTGTPAKPYLTTEGAAVLCRTTPAEIRPHLLELARAHLLEQHLWERGVPPERWRMHDLIILFAGERTDKERLGEEVGEAVYRFMHYCLEKDYTNDIKAHIELDGVRVATTRFHEELGCWVWAILPTWELLDRVPSFENLVPGSTWSEEHQVWIPPDSDEARGSLQASWEKDMELRWGNRPFAARCGHMRCRLNAEKELLTIVHLLKTNLRGRDMVRNFVCDGHHYATVQFHERLGAYALRVERDAVDGLPEMRRLLDPVLDWDEGHQVWVFIPAG